MYLHTKVSLEIKTAIESIAIKQKTSQGGAVALCVQAYKQYSKTEEAHVNTFVDSFKEKFVKVAETVKEQFSTHGSELVKQELIKHIQEEL